MSSQAIVEKAPALSPEMAALLVFGGTYENFGIRVHGSGVEGELRTLEKSYARKKETLKSTLKETEGNLGRVRAVQNLLQTTKSPEVLKTIATAFTPRKTYTDKSGVKHVAGLKLTEEGESLLKGIVLKPTKKRAALEGEDWVVKPEKKDDENGEDDEDYDEVDEEDDSDEDGEGEDSKEGVVVFQPLRASLIEKILYPRRKSGAKKPKV